MKLCLKCNSYKDENEFPKDKSRKDGRFPYCKVCEYARERKWRREPDNAEKTRETQRRWYAKPASKLLVAASQERFYLRHPEKIEENSNRLISWRLANPERWNDCLKNNKHKRRAKLSIMETDIDVDWLNELKSNSNECVICKVIMTEETSPYDPTHKNLDHIKPICAGGSHTKDNVRYICRKCNLEKIKEDKKMKRELDCCM